ncbi:uncharacterized protein IL334_000687 [Kwoniella shivajii]|uniref:Rab-GAP TBC domain-containing protein n=1 Tax=Kwoniella shivajii TaxID=564305 RepID=A0ABZ1CU24_9TREE|nr:hypothetical protein IL334_000687 [Kwoniella shivajii]
MSSASPLRGSPSSSTRKSPVIDPSSPHVHAAEELELDDQSSLSEDVTTPSISSFRINASSSPSSTTSMSMSPEKSKSVNGDEEMDENTTPVKSGSKKKPAPSKVKAAAAMFENKSSSSPNSMSSSSFRSIPVSSNRNQSKSPSPSPSSQKLSPSPNTSSPYLHEGNDNSNSNNRSPSNSSPSPSFSPTSKHVPSDSPSSSKWKSKSPELKLNSPFSTHAVSPSPINTPSPSNTNLDKFSDVSLLNDTPQFEDIAHTPTTSSTSFKQHRNISISPIPTPPPVPVNISHSLPEPITTPPAKEPTIPSTGTGKTSFFGSTLGFGFPSSSSSSMTTTTNNTFNDAENIVGGGSVSLEPSRSTSTSASASTATSNNSQNQVGGGWKSTMTNFLSSRSTSSTTNSPLPSTTENDSTPMRPSMPERNPSEGTSFLLQRVDSSLASRDRRISAQLGGGQAIRDGFERVRGQMESAAREMRRERESKAITENNEDVLDDSILDEIKEESEEEKVDWNFWGAVVQDFENVARENPKELSKAIQMGIPPVIRGAIWQLMSSSKSTPLEETYKALLKLPSSHEKAINKDLNRTFPNHKYFQDCGGIGQEGLFMVVKAYSLYDPEVGYTQGLAFIVAALLLNMPDEEAFCVLVRLMDSYNLRSHYTAEMHGLQLRLFQFDRLVEEILPLVHTHFVRQGVKSSIYAAQWFMTLFSYRFPLSLVYRVLDIVFAEGIEAIFRFSLALLKKSEDKLLELEFEQILNFLQSDLFEVYRVEGMSTSDISHEEEEWKANEFVRDAYEIRITPFMLDSYASEWEEQQKSQNRHAQEVDTLRNANRNLSTQVKQLEASLATMNQEHVELVRQLVMSKIEKEETENELVRYKMLYAELAHAQQDALSTHSRLSGGSIHSQNMSSRPSS